jgi:hypothetical protein
MTSFKLSPSDLTFTWDECHYCFYMKVRHGISLHSPFPSIFGRMANLTSGFYLGRAAAEIDPGLPQGTVKYREQYVRSVPLSLPGCDSQCYIHGRFDAVIAFADGSYGIVDYKTSEAKPETIPFYSRQLTAYAYALEHPAPGALGLYPVSRMGLLVITPEGYERSAVGGMAFASRATWLEVPRNDAAFTAFLEQVMAVLDAPLPPKPSETCGVCQYRREMQAFPS